VFIGGDRRNRTVCQNLRSYGFAIVRYPVFEIDAHVSHLRTDGAGIPGISRSATSLFGNGQENTI
jgi:hypothetical protein